MDCAEVAELAGLPEGWVRNVIETRTLFALQPRRGYYLRYQNGLVYVPSTFGQVEVTLD